MIELYTSRWSNRDLARLRCQPVGISQPGEPALLDRLQVPEALGARGCRRCPAGPPLPRERHGGSGLSPALVCFLVARADRPGDPGVGAGRSARRRRGAAASFTLAGARRYPDDTRTIHRRQGAPRVTRECYESSTGLEGRPGREPLDRVRPQRDPSS